MQNESAIQQERQHYNTPMDDQMWFHNRDKGAAYSSEN